MKRLSYDSKSRVTSVIHNQCREHLKYTDSGLALKLNLTEKCGNRIVKTRNFSTT